jgi:large subunit ribosomal protein L18
MGSENVARSRERARRKRHDRIRVQLSGTAAKPRLIVFKSLSHIYAQLIDDVNGTTLVSASTLDKDVDAGTGHRGNVSAAKKVGASIAQKAMSKDIKTVVFDRGGYQYHGSIKALADAAREQGLKF